MPAPPNTPVNTSQFFRHRRIVRSLFVACGYLACSLNGHAQGAPVHLKIAAVKEVADSFTSWTSVTPWEQIDRYSGSYVNRPTLDLVLELQVLKAGGLNFDFELVPMPNHERSRHEIIDGHVDLSAETEWDSRYAADAESLLRSDALVKKGEFEKGIYTLPGNSGLLRISSIEELRKFVGATVGTWTLDVKALSAMNLKDFETAITLENVFLMIDKKRADFTLVEFSSNADLGVELGGVKLVPVPNCKVVLDDSRSWIIAKKSPNAEAILAAFRKGLVNLRDSGRIERAMVESGFLNSKVSSWKQL
jgi:hypothetical protein